MMQPLGHGDRRRSGDSQTFPFAAILWDLDGTLVDSEPVHRRSFLDACSALGLSLPHDFHDRLVGMSEEAIHRLMVTDFGLDLPFAEWSETRFSAYLARIQEVHPISSAQAIWRMAAAIGVSQGIVSNSPRRIVSANVERFGLAPGELVTISRNDVSSAKPSPEPYLLAARRLSVEPASVVVVEDSAAGLESARSAGMSAFMMPSFAGSEGETWQPIETLRQILLQLSPR